MKRTTVFDEMNRLFEEMRHSMAENRFEFDVGYGSGVPVRMEADDEGYLVHADLPGFETEEIDLRFEDGRLTIEARHEGSHDGEQWSRHVNESVRIPGDVVIEGIEASYHNGVLEISVPTESEAESTGHRIDID